MPVDPLQHVDEIIVRVNVVQAAGDQQALHDADVPGAELSPGKKPIAVVHRNDLQCTFQVVGIDRQVRIIQRYTNNPVRCSRIDASAPRADFQQGRKLFCCKRERNVSLLLIGKLAGRCPSHYRLEATPDIDIKNISARVTTILTTVIALIPSDRTNSPKLGVY